MPFINEYRTLVESSEVHDGHVWGGNADRYFPDEEAMIGWVEVKPILAELLRVPFYCPQKSCPRRLLYRDDARLMGQLEL